MSTQNAAHIKRVLSLHIIIKALSKKSFIMLKHNSINVHSNTAIKSVNRLAVSFSIGDFGDFDFQTRFKFTHHYKSIK